MRQNFFLYIFILFFISLADAIMSYIAPVMIESAVGNATLMGVVFASSSLAGMAVDFFFAKNFHGKKSGFFLKILCSVCILFPLSLLLYQTIPSLILAMIVWGVYFEAMVFANFHAVHDYMSMKEHAWGWGLLSTARSSALVIGPFVASSLSLLGTAVPLWMAVCLYTIGITLFLAFGFLRSHEQKSDSTRAIQERRSVKQEWKIWEVFEGKLWPLVTLLLLFYFVDSAFMTAGPLFAEKLKETTVLGTLFVSLYCLPDLLIGFFTGKLARPFGKKRMAFFAGILSGGGLLLMSVFEQVSILFFGTLVASIGLAILHPQVLATFEDFIARSGKFGNDLIGLTAIAGSIPYVIGPIVNGLIIDGFGERAVFGSWGVILSLYCVLLFFIVPRKVKLPKSDLTHVASV